MEPVSVADERPELTDLSSFNKMQEMVSRYWQHHVALEQVLETWQSVDQELGPIISSFHHNVQYQPSTPELEECLPTVYDAFERLRRLWPTLPNLLREGKRARVESVMERCQQSLNRLFDAFKRLRQAEEQEPRYSEVPPVQEILRVGHAFASGRLPLERFRERLDEFIAFQQVLNETFEELNPTPQEMPILIEQDAFLRESLHLQQEGVERVERALEQQSSEELERGLEEVRAGAEGLAQVQRMLAGAGQGAESKMCLRCSAENPASARYCEQCNAVFPAVEHLDSSAPSLNILEQDESNRPLPENLQMLSMAIEQVRAGALPPEEFLKTLEFLEGRLEAVARRLQNLEEPPAETPPDQMEIYLAARSSIEMGGEEVGAGLDALRSFVNRRDPNILDYGFEQVASGMRQMSQVEDLYQQMNASSGSDQ